MKKIDKLVVCGVGLIGGSFALALRRAGLVKRIDKRIRVVNVSDAQAIEGLPAALG